MQLQLYRDLERQRSRAWRNHGWLSPHHTPYWWKKSNCFCFCFFNTGWSAEGVQGPTWNANSYSKSANQVNLANPFRSCRFVRSAMEPILSATEASSSWCDQHWSSLVTIHAGKSFQLILCCKFLLQENCHGMFKTKKKKNRGICDQFTERILANLYSIGIMISRLLVHTGLSKGDQTQYASIRYILKINFWFYSQIGLSDWWMFKVKEETEYTFW